MKNFNVKTRNQFLGRSFLGKSKKVFYLFVLVILSSCAEVLMWQNTPNQDIASKLQDDAFGVWDGAHGGIEGFYFLPPIVKEPSFIGEFDPNLSPVLEIGVDKDFTQILGTVELGNSVSSILLNEIDQQYQFNWNIGSFGESANKHFRIRVRVGDMVLGYADFFIVQKSNQKVGAGLIKAVINQTVPIKFRIEKNIASSMEIDPEEAIIKVGDEIEFQAKVLDLHGQEINGLSIYWASENESVATISQDGVAMGVEEGQTNIWASYSYLTASASIAVERGDTPPPPGRDIVVFNDVNIFDNFALESDVNNVVMLRNLVNYTSTGLRSTAKKVWLDCGKNSRYPFFCSEFTRFKEVIEGEGYSVQTISSPTNSIIGIDPEVKVLFLILPLVNYTLEEVNSLKQFAEEGGRIIFVGEYLEFYTSQGIQVENNLLINLGAELRNVGNAVDCNYTLLPNTSLRPNQITNGMTGLTVACASVIVPGPNDFPLFFDTGNSLLLAGVAAINTTPISNLQTARLLPSVSSARLDSNLSTTGKD
ncbi:Ig-like domain-containing protein [Algoriphagus mannitolivorans]|uniref:Ig-like domain-containing protein n=1 Tax=Algoriphagus mannitolivorans TaxID=226504 RepID=UPI0004114267|nr:Ig-like domain-containing protein [Algoriphagus mannitolivorans]